jgi:signal transduction histidine kinase
MPANLAYLRLVSFITIFGMSLFLVVDFFKEVDFSIVLAARSVALAVASFTMWVSFRNDVSVREHFACIALIMFTNFGASIATAMFGGMPPYYITNLLFLMFVLVVTASGLNFRHAFYLNTVCMMVFLIYSQFIKRDPFYFSQYAHLFSILAYITIAGSVLEERRRSGFLNFSELAKQKQLVEDLNQQKNKIISILSHDIAAPLHSLSGLLNLQTRGLVEPDQIAPYVSQVGDRIENVHLLLQSLMRWSKSQIDGFVADKKMLSLTDELANTCQQFSVQIKEKSLTVKMPQQPVHGWADKDMISLVFRNLLSNAIKFSELNSTITMDTKKIENNIVIAFMNQGNPIPADQQNRLFTYQVDSTVGTAGEKGTGLGLALSAYFCQLNDGKIYLEKSVPGETVFCVELPADEEKKDS